MPRYFCALWPKMARSALIAPEGDGANDTVERLEPMVHFKDDGISGATTKRPALLRCLKKLEPDDTLIVWKLDRLGRSLRDLITMLDELKQRGVKFRSLTEHIDTDTPTGRAM